MVFDMGGVRIRTSTARTGANIDFSTVLARPSIRSERSSDKRVEVRSVTGPQDTSVIGKRPCDFGHSGVGGSLPGMVGCARSTHS